MIGRAPGGLLSRAAALIIVCGASCASSQTVRPRVADEHSSTIEYLVLRDYGPDDASLAPGRTLAYSAVHRLADSVEQQLQRRGYQTTDLILKGGDVELTLDVLMAGPSNSEPEGAMLLATAWVVGRRMASEAIVFDPGDELAEEEFETVLELVTRPAVTARVLQVRAEEARERQLRQQQSDQEAADHAAWNESNSAECRRAKREEACEGVARYLRSFPSGLHQDEARRAKEEGYSSGREPSAYEQLMIVCGRSGSKRCLVAAKVTLCKWPCALEAETVKAAVPDIREKCSSGCRCCSFCTSCQVSAHGGVETAELSCLPHARAAGAGPTASSSDFIPDPVDWNPTD